MIEVDILEEKYLRALVLVSGVESLFVHIWPFFWTVKKLLKFDWQTIIAKKKAVEGTLWKTNTWKLCNLPAFGGSTMASLFHCWQAIVFCPLSHPFEIMAHNFFRLYKKVGLHSFFFFLIDYFSCVIAFTCLYSLGYKGFPLLCSLVFFPSHSLLVYQCFHFDSSSREVSVGSRCI